MDVVLNALAAEAIPMGLSCLAEFGRFIEIGKRDIYQNSRIPLWPLRRMPPSTSWRWTPSSAATKH